MLDGNHLSWQNRNSRMNQNLTETELNLNQVFESYCLMCCLYVAGLKS